MKKGGLSPSGKTGEEEHEQKKLNKLHWREAYIHNTTFSGAKEESIWNEISHIDIDKDKLAVLFELKQSEIKAKVSLSHFSPNFSSCSCSAWLPFNTPGTRVTWFARKLAKSDPFERASELDD